MTKRVFHGCCRRIRKTAAHSIAVIVIAVMVARPAFADIPLPQSESPSSGERAAELARVSRNELVAGGVLTATGIIGAVMLGLGIWSESQPCTHSTNYPECQLPSIGVAIAGGLIAPTVFAGVPLLAVGARNRIALQRLHGLSASALPTPHASGAILRISFRW